MKLLLDQTLPRKIVQQIDTTYPDSCHLTAVLSETSDDASIWDFAKQNGYAIITKDDDFERRSILLGHPPKVVWIRLGNCTTAEVVNRLINNADIVTAFSMDDEKSILALP